MFVIYYSLFMKRYSLPILLIRIFLITLMLIIWSTCSHFSSKEISSQTNRSKIKYKVTIYRDTWGVPHIFGKTDADAAYGLAYANAEDDLQNIQDALLAARGKLASVYGKDKAPNDYMVHLFEIWRKVDSRYATDLSSATKKICEAYADGVNQYILDHPGEALPGVYPVTGKDLVAGFIHKTPLFFGVQNFLKKMMERKPEEFKSNAGWWEDHQKDREKMVTKGSNVFAVSSSRSEDEKIRLAINSHQPWDGPFAWYEAHIHSEEGWNMTGGLFPGSPIVLVGHNEHLGWGHTVNAPDLVDVYELEIHPDDPYLYKYDGEWQFLRVKKVPIKVKLFGPFSWTFKKEVLWSVHGPVLRGKHATYAIRYANYEDIRVIEQWYRMNKAANFKEWESAMQMMSIPLFGTGYADKEGNILYLYNAKLPIRSEGYDWQGVLPGNSSDVVWTEYLPYEDLPQVLNPVSGFIQNCNNTPFITTTGDNNPNREKYSDTFGIESRMSNRALRALELFGKDQSISAKEFEQYKYDMRYSDESYMSQFVNRVISLSDNFEDDQLMEGVDILKSWDKNTDFENKHASLPIISFGWFMETSPDVVPDEQLIESFTFGVKYLYNHYGRLDVIWGNVNRLIRGSLNLGIAGGPDVSHAVYGLPTEEGYLKGYAGDAFLMLVEWGKDGQVSSQSIHQYGSNTQHESSTHYSDQARLFVNRNMKPVWMTLQVIKENVERVYSPSEGK